MSQHTAGRPTTTDHPAPQHEERRSSGHPDVRGPNRFPAPLLWMVVVGACAAAVLMLIERLQASLLIGQWVPIALLCALYSRLLKVIEADRAPIRR